MINMNQVTGWGYMVPGDSAARELQRHRPDTRVSYSPSSSFLISGCGRRCWPYPRNLTPEQVNLHRGPHYRAPIPPLFPEGRAIRHLHLAEFRDRLTKRKPGRIRSAGCRYRSRRKTPRCFARYRAEHPGYVAMEVESGVTTAHGLYMDPRLPGQPCARRRGSGVGLPAAEVDG